MEFLGGLFLRLRRPSCRLGEGRILGILYRNFDHPLIDLWIDVSGDNSNRKIVSKVEARPGADHLLHLLVIVLSLQERILLFPTHQKEHNVSSSFSSSSSHALQHADRGSRCIIADNEIDLSNVQTFFTNRGSDNYIDLSGFEILNSLELLCLIHALRPLRVRLPHEYRCPNHGSVSVQHASNILSTVPK